MVAHNHQAPWRTAMDQKVLRARKRREIEALSRYAPRTLPHITATIPERKEPKARERTENHTGLQSVKVLQHHRGKTYKPGT